MAAVRTAEGAGNILSEALIAAYQFAEDGTPTPISENEIEKVLENPKGWVWLHLALTDKRASEWIGQHAPLSSLGRKSLVSTDEHLHLDIVGKEVIGTLPDLRRELASGSEDIGRLRFVMMERLLISGRRMPLHAVEETRRAIETGQQFNEAIDLIETIMHQFAEAVSELAHRFSEQLDEIEDRLVRDEPSDERQNLGRVRMRTIRIQRQVAHVQSLFHRIEPRLGPERPRISSAVRMLSNKLDSVDHQLAAVYDRSHLLYDELGAKTADLTNRRLLTLSVLQACLLPPTLVSGGYFGMNTMDLLFKETPNGSFYAALISLSAGALTYIGLRLFRAL